MGKEAVGGYTPDEDFKIDIDIEADPDRELVRVPNAKGQMVEITRGAQRAGDLSTGRVGTPLERMAQLEKDVAAKNFFVGLEKVGDLRGKEQGAMEAARKILDSGTTEERQKVEIILQNIQTLIGRLKQIADRPNSEAIPDSAHMTRDLFVDVGQFMDELPANMGEVKQELVDEIKTLYWRLENRQFNNVEKI